MAMSYTMCRRAFGRFYCSMFLLNVFAQTKISSGVCVCCGCPGTARDLAGGDESALRHASFGKSGIPVGAQGSPPGVAQSIADQRKHRGDEASSVRKVEENHLSLVLYYTEKRLCEYMSE